MIEDLPVAVTLPSPLDTQVALWIERDLGWQVVDEGGPLEPVVALSDRACGPLPWIAVTDGPPDGEQVRHHLTAGALDVVAWPHDRMRIPLLAARVEHGRGAGDHRRRLTIAGAAGGAGTSTVALAIGGLLAWSGAAVLVSGCAELLSLAGVSRDQLQPAQVAPMAVGPARSETTGPPLASEAPSLVPDRSAPSPVPGVPRLSVVGDGVDVATAAWTGDIVVVDGGTVLAPETTIVVSRPDRNIERARASGRPVIVVGDRPLSGRDCRRVLGSALLAHLPMSSRVARAGLHGHVPAALPGAWLRELRTALAGLEGRS